MGYNLVGAALQPHWGAVLTPREQLILVSMCHLALDESSGPLPPRTFWAGESYLMLVTLGREYHRQEEGYKAASEGIRRALRKLEEVGAIRRTRTAANALRAEYEVLVMQGPLPVDKASDEARQRLGLPHL